MLLTTFLALLTTASGARILALIPTPSYSHQTALWPIWKQLSMRGHNVTLVTTDPINDPRLTNLTEIKISEAYKFWRPLFDDMESVHNPFKSYQVIEPILQTILDFLLESKEIKTLVTNKTTFDLVMVEAMFPELLIFGELYKCPTVLVSSLGGFPRIQGAIGNSVHPIAYPCQVLPYFGNLSFKERLISFVFFLDHWFRQIPRGRSLTKKILRKHFGEGASEVAHLLDKVAMTFFNVHPALDGVKPVGPNTIHFGGMVHIRDPQPLPKDLEHFLNTSEEGVVYFSLGSNVFSADVAQTKFGAIVQALGELPYKVLLKYEATEIPQKPENIKCVKWIPQQDVLNHPNIKAFVTQGGLQSLEEAIYNNVPVVVLPFLGDQEQNAKKVELKRIGKAIYHMRNGLSKDELNDAITEVIENASYRQNIRSLAKIMLDEPMTGVEKVVWWTEYVIRHKGAGHFRSHVLDMPLYQYFMLDILAFFILAFIVFLVVTLFICKTSKNCIKFVVRHVKFKRE